MVDVPCRLDVGVLGPEELDDSLCALCVRLLRLYIDYINDQGGLLIGLLHQEVGGPTGAGCWLNYVCGPKA